MIGRRLGPWVIDAELGRGAMGVVYRARRADDDPAGPDAPAVAAVKVLSRELARDAVFVGRFRREIEAVSQLAHPNIVRFYDAGGEGDELYYAMEYVDGPDYHAILHERGRLPWMEVLDLALQVVPALKHAHDRGIIHRDLKPSNLLQARNGEVTRPDPNATEPGTEPVGRPARLGAVKLTDFGVAKLFAAPALTAAGSFVGTAAYLAPEQAAGKPATKRSDLYALGGVLYTLLTGRPPFPGENVAELLHKHCYAVPDRPQALVPDIPHDVDGLVMQLLEKDPARRPADGLVLLRQLERLRGKYERKAAYAANTDDVATIINPSGDPAVSVPRPAGAPLPGKGPATLMAGMMRCELHEMNKGGPIQRFFNHPLVLLAMLAACVGLIAFGLTRKKPTAEELYEQAKPLMASERPADWQRAWTDYLEPMAERYPDHPYKAEVAAFRQWSADLGEQLKALERAQAATPSSVAERFYRRGLQRLQDGDAAGARRTWEDLATAFRGVPGEDRWVALAERGLKTINVPPPAARDGAARAALERARQLRDDGKPDAARRIWDALEALYRDDPAAAEVLAELRRDRSGGR